MLTLEVSEKELFNNRTSEFVYVKPIKLEMEHSLLSLENWEAKWRKSFMQNKDKLSIEEMRDYFRCMTITKNVPSIVYDTLSQEEVDTIIDYINNPMTATWFSEDKSSKPNREIITAELIYYWMIAQNIPFECRKWHLNKLLTLIQVCSIKNAPEKKMSPKDAAAQRQALNAARRAKYNSKG